MRILEFARSTDRSLRNVASYLSSELGGMDRVGGKTRVFQMEDSNRPMALYVTRDGKYGIGLSWESGQHDTLGITTVYVWYNFEMNASADLAIDIPMEFSFDESKELLVKTIKTPEEGVITESSVGQITEMARRSNEAEFTQMAQAKFGSDSARLTWPEIVALAADNDVQVPGTIRMNRDLKVDAHHWNLSGAATAADAPRSFDQDFETKTGQKIDQDAEDSEEIQVLKGLKAVNSLAAKGKKLYLMSHKPNGAFYRIPNAEGLLAALQRAYENAVNDGDEDGPPSMEEQYENLQARVKLVASGESNFIKSLLIMGAPSSGKTFSVMQAVKSVGLEEGTDYVVKKGRISVPNVYRTLIEQVNGMVIFDDCDSVVGDKDGINMLKGALDTDPVREISYDVGRKANTAVMTAAERDDYVDMCSRILRGKPTEDDLRYFFRRVRKEYREDGEWVDPVFENEDLDELQNDVEQYVMNNLPNKIDFKGRIIFISNMSEDEWDSAIITRAFTIDMNFSSGEMLDYIDKIKGHIKTPSLNEEQKQEVVDYLRDLYTTGRLVRDVNFRLMMQCFDIRLIPGWKQQIASTYGAKRGR